MRNIKYMQGGMKARGKTFAEVEAACALEGKKQDMKKRHARKCGHGACQMRLGPDQKL